MAEPLRPDATPTHGKHNWIFVASIASAAKIPTAVEVNAASSLDFTNIVFNGSHPAPQKNTNLVEQEQRFGDTESYERVGKTKWGGGEMVYQFNPQGAAASDGVKAWEKFLNSSGTVTGFLVRRMGVAKATTPAAGQFVDVYPVEIGPSQPLEQGEGETAEAAASCTYAVTSAPAFKKALT